MFAFVIHDRLSEKVFLWSVYNNSLTVYGPKKSTYEVYSMVERNPFCIRSCTLAAIATGEHATSLLGLRDKLVTIPLDSIYFHFWGGRLFPHFTHPEFHNDFAMWVHESLHDECLAEKLGVLDPTEYSSLEDLRTDLVDIVEWRLNEYDVVPIGRKDDLFHFVRCAARPLRDVSCALLRESKTPCELRVLARP